MKHQNDAVPSDGQSLLGKCSNTFTEKEIEQQKKNEIIEPQNEKKTRDDDYSGRSKPDRICDKVIKFTLYLTRLVFQSYSFLLSHLNRTRHFLLLFL